MLDQRGNRKTQHGAQVMPSKSKGKTEFVQWMAPLLDSLREAGGSARPKEVSAWIAQRLRLPSDITSATLKSGANRFHNQVQWARQYLVWQGLIDDGKRGTWTLTPLGWKTHLDDRSARALFLERVKISHAVRRSEGEKKSPSLQLPTVADISERPPADEAEDQDLLGVLKSLPPYGFELVCARLLREHGFEEVEVTQRARDGGIDGYGVLRLGPFVSVRVAFQAKRYEKAVPRRDVGEFRNAMLGRAEKGVFLTTGYFTPDAESEAARAGVVPIELIDGERLVELFQTAQLGLRPRQTFVIDHSFFDEFRQV